MITFFHYRTAPLLPALLIGILLGACATGGNSRENPAQGSTPGAFRPGGTNKTAGAALYSRNEMISLWEKAPPGLEVKIPALEISLNLLDTKALAGGTGETERELERLLRETFYRGLSVQDYTEEQIRVQTMSYRDMGEEARHNIEFINSESLNWNYVESFKTQADRALLLIISRDRFSYSGGAHPNYDRTYFVFDREVGMRVSLSDIIRKGAEPTLKELINQELRRHKKIGPGDSLKKAAFLVDEAEITENFFFSPQGVSFHWDPYELAPYSEGYVETTIPYTVIREMLTPEGRRLAREFGGG
ncbi:MAG: RsiV family protein [Treponema sp.]|jgi:hypothetical protein|nr:RsiV family protein [Treponema sp.]